jgi:hypothetical protein
MVKEEEEEISLYQFNKLIPYNMLDKSNKTQYYVMIDGKKKKLKKLSEIEYNNKYFLHTYSNVSIININMQILIENKNNKCINPCNTGKSHYSFSSSTSGPSGSIN